VPLAYQGTQAWDRYAYINNNPLRFTDPTGHCIDGATTLFCIFVAAMAVGAVVDASVNAYNQYQDTGHVDAGEVFTHAWEGALIGGGVVIGAAAAISLLPVTTVAGAACADGDCGNEASSVVNSLNQACGSDMCASEVKDVGDDITAGLQHWQIKRLMTLLF